MAARIASSILFVAGLSIAGFTPDEPAQGPRELNGEWIVAADLHVHAFPGDGSLLPVDLAREARRRGLDAIVISNHNTMLATRFIDAQSSSGTLVVPGEEIITPAFHLVAAGITRPIGWRGSSGKGSLGERSLSERSLSERSLSEIVQDVHAQGGAAILAHPGAPRAVETAGLALLDGVEVAHTVMHVRPEAGRSFRDAFARAASVQPHIAPIGSTDFHAVAPIGLCRTFVFARERSIAGMVDAIRRGRTVACDQNGETTGDAALAREVSADCRASAAARLRWPGRDQLAVALSWLGLFGLMTLRRGV